MPFRKSSEDTQLAQMTSSDPKIPVELRLVIWQEVIAEMLQTPRSVEISYRHVEVPHPYKWYERNKENRYNDVREIIESKTKSPSFMNVCRETEAAALEMGYLLLDQCASTGCRPFFHPEIDTLFVTSENAPQSHHLSQFTKQAQLTMIHKQSQLFSWFSPSLYPNLRHVIVDRQTWKNLLAHMDWSRLENLKLIDIIVNQPGNETPERKWERTSTRAGAIGFDIAYTALERKEQQVIGTQVEKIFGGNYSVVRGSHYGRREGLLFSISVNVLTRNGVRVVDWRDEKWPENHKLYSHGHSDDEDWEPFDRCACQPLEKLRLDIVSK